jgi:hypothetical protein
MSDERVSMADLTCSSCGKMACAGVCQVCHRHLPRIAEGGACICISHFPSELEQIVEDTALLRVKGRWTQEQVDDLCKEARQHYTNRDAAALERMIRGLFT